MRVCLVSPPTITDFAAEVALGVDEVRGLGTHPPMGVLSLAAVLTERGLTPRLLDLNAEYVESPPTEFFASGLLRVCRT